MRLRGAALALAAITASCGRIDFDPLGDGALPPSISHVAPFAATQISGNTVTTFTAHAQQAGDTVLLAVTCQNGTPTAVSVTASGWTFSQAGPVAGATSNRYIASFAATAPDTAAATFTVTWTSPTSCGGMNEIADEFAASGGAIAIDAHAEAFTGSTPAAMLTTMADNDLVWGACSSSGTLQAPGAGYTKGGDDGHDDWSEYKLTSDPAGTVELVDFTSTGSSYGLVAVALAVR